MVGENLEKTNPLNIFCVPTIEWMEVSRTRLAIGRLLTGAHSQLV